MEWSDLHPDLEEAILKCVWRCSIPTAPYSGCEIQRDHFLNFRLVCKRWCQALDSFARRLSLTPEFCPATPEKITTFMARFPSVEKISVIDFRTFIPTDESTLRWGSESRQRTRTRNTNYGQPMWSSALASFNPTTLRSLSISNLGCSTPTDLCRYLNQLAGFTALTELNLEEECANFDLEGLEALTALKTLGLAGMGGMLDADMYIVIASLTNLTALDLTGCTFNIREGLEEVAAFTALRTLNLTNTGLDDGVLMGTLAKMTGLTYLDLSGNSLISHGGIRQLSGILRTTYIEAPVGTSEVGSEDEEEHA